MSEISVCVHMYVNMHETSVYKHWYIHTYIHMCKSSGVGGCEGGSHSMMLLRPSCPRMRKAHSFRMRSPQRVVKLLEKVSQYKQLGTNHKLLGTNFTSDSVSDWLRVIFLNKFILLNLFNSVCGI